MTRVPHKGRKCNEAYPLIVYIAPFAPHESCAQFWLVHFEITDSDRVYATKQLEEVRAEARGVLQNELVEVRQEVRPARVPPQRG